MLALCRQHTLHFTSDENTRLFGHAATCFYFPSSAWHRWAYGGLRRHFHYSEQLMHNASLILHHLLQDIGPFNAVHFRNTDLALQYESFSMTPAAIRDRLLQQFDPQQGLFIATEKPDRDYLRPLLDAFPKARFLDQYIMHLPGTPQRYYGLLDQVVASCACTFVGTLGSTFSSFIVRIRGHLPPALAPNKECYFTVKNVTGDAAADDAWTRSMLYPVTGSTQWELPIWSRDYSVMWELD